MSDLGFFGSRTRPARHLLDELPRGVEGVPSFDVEGAGLVRNLMKKPHFHILYNADLSEF